MIIISTAKSTIWGYTELNGPNTWGKLSENYILSEKGKRQSPIAIEKAATILNDKTKINAQKWDTLMTGNLRNTGYGVEYKPNSDSCVPLLEASVDFPGIELNHPFRLLQFHFHWGTKDDEGSEHSVDGEKGCGEIHFVYVNNKYENATIALKEIDGVVVVGYLLKLAEKSAFDDLFKHLPSVKVAKDELKDVPLQISSFFKEYPGNGGFYVYQGSLTTPPCYESVTWFLSCMPLGIHREQLALLRSQKVDEKTELSSNFRPTQPLNGRKIYHILCKFLYT